MIQVNLKRKWGNRSTVRGILDIPDYGFKCYTLELKESKSQFKNNCCVDSGVYELTNGFAEGSVFFPKFRHRVAGFPLRPRFDLQDLDYSKLSTGMIAVGYKKDEFSLSTTYDFQEAFKKVFEEIFEKRQPVYLNIYKGKYYEFTEVAYEDENSFALDLVDEADDDDERKGATG